VKAVIGVVLIASAAALFLAFRNRGGGTHPLLAAGALSWIVPVTVTSLLALGLTLSLDAVLRGS
jgi:hypothetical protein